MVQLPFYCNNTQLTLYWLKETVNLFKKLINLPFLICNDNIAGVWCGWKREVKTEAPQSSNWITRHVNLNMRKVLKGKTFLETEYKMAFLWDRIFVQIRQPEKHPRWRPSERSWAIIHRSYKLKLCSDVWSLRESDVWLLIGTSIHRSDHTSEQSQSQPSNVWLLRYMNHTSDVWRVHSYIGAPMFKHSFRRIGTNIRSPFL